MHASVLFFAGLPACASHYLWLTRTADKAVITFSEVAGVPGPEKFLSALEPHSSVHLAVHPENLTHRIPLSLDMVSRGHWALMAPLPVSANTMDTMLEGEGTWGLFPELNKTSPPLLKYWFSAHHTTKPNGWFYIDAESTNRLSVTLRALPCTAPQTHTTVVVVARFNGTNLGTVHVKIFDAAGKSLGSVTTSPHGVGTITLQAGHAAYALMNHMEAATGIDPTSGKPYEEIAHYATHHTIVDQCIAAPAIVEPTTTAATSEAVPVALASAAAETARWLVELGTWGHVTTLSSETTIAEAVALPTAEVLSYGEDATGRLFFYIMGWRDGSAGHNGSGGGISDYPASLTMSQAGLNATKGCEMSQLDPEDPRCAKITFSGRMTHVINHTGVAHGKASLFAKHPQMASWPVGHNFQVWELVLSEIWMIDFYGGGSNIDPTDFHAAKPKHNVPKWPPNAERPGAGMTLRDSAEAANAGSSVTVTRATSATDVDPAPPPPYAKVAARARWLVYHSTWASIGTISVHLHGSPWGNVRSIADGTGSNSTGLPVLYLPTPDPTAIDINANAHTSVSFTEAALSERVTPDGKTCGGKDAEDPTCARLHMIGTLQAITNKGAQAEAAAKMCAKHPYATWLCHGGAHTGGTWYTVKPTALHFLDFYGGPAKLTVEEYLAAAPPGAQLTE